MYLISVVSPCHLHNKQSLDWGGQEIRINQVMDRLGEMAIHWGKWGGDTDLEVRKRIGLGVHK